MIYFNSKHQGYFSENEVESNIVFTCTEEVYGDFMLNIDKYIWVDDKLVVRPEWEAEQSVKESERIKMLKMTRGDLFEYTIISKGLDEANIRALIEQDKSLDAVTKKLYLNRFDNALHFYRGHPAVDFIGNKIGMSKEELDALFEEKNAVE